MKTVGSVYFIVQEDDEGDFHPDINTPIKVGISTNIKTRLSNLQTGNPNRLFLLGWITTIEYKKLEKELHQQLIGEKIRGEWFELDSHIVIEILKQNNGNLVREREQLTFLGYDRDGIPEFLGVWDWWDFDPECSRRRFHHTFCRFKRRTIWYDLTGFPSLPSYKKSTQPL